MIGYLSSRLTVYQKLAALNPDDAVTQYELAQAAQDASNSKVAIAAYEKFLNDTPFQLLTAHSLAEARAVLSECRPRAIILDVLLG